jgi:hypothetical protein
MFSIIFLSLLSLGCSNEVPPDSAEADGPLSSTESPSDGTGSSDGNVSTSSSEEEGSTSSDTSASDGTSEQAPVDADGDGFSVDEDCDDQDASINPRALEVCDGIDNDCDGQTDPTGTADAPTWYLDADADGFGSGLGRLVACQAPDSNWVDNDLDCDDDDAQVHPDAEEVCDGVDSDCDGAEDHGTAAWYSGGGSVAEDVTDLMESGIFHRLDHGTLKLCEGTFNTRFEFELSGMSASIESKVKIEGIGNVEINGLGEGRLIEVGDGVGELELINLRLKNGESDIGGAVHAEALDLILEDVSFTENHADGRGGAVFIGVGSLDMERVEFLRNTASGFGAHGGAIFLAEGDIVGVDVTMQANTSTGMSNGGAIHLSAGNVHLEGSSVTDNTASYRGGAIANFDGDVVLVDSVIEDNSSLAGGAIYVGGSLDVIGTVISGNEANTGGAVLLREVDGWQSINCEDDGAIRDNHAAIKGSGIYVGTPFGTTIDSDSCDWGTGSNDNGEGVDIGTPDRQISAADDATFTCTNGWCIGDVSVTYGS